MYLIALNSNQSLFIIKNLGLQNDLVLKNAGSSEINVVQISLKKTLPTCQLCLARIPENGDIIYLDILSSYHYWISKSIRPYENNKSKT